MKTLCSDEYSCLYSNFMRFNMLFTYGKKKVTGFNI